MSSKGRKTAPTKKVEETVVAKEVVSTPVVAVTTAGKKKVTKKAEPVMPVVEKPVVVVVAAPTEEPATVAKKSVGKGKVVAKSPVSVASTASSTGSTKKTATKSPVAKKTTTKKTTAKKSPAKKSAKKSPAKKSAKKSPTKKASAKKGKGKTKAVAKKAKSKRVHNTKPATMDTSGIGVGPARVKAVLINAALDEKYYIIRLMIMAAENKPRKPKPTKEDPNPVMPAQGPQTPIDKLPADVLSVIRKAEAAHEASLRESYERSVVSAMDEKTRLDYNTKRKDAHAVADEAHAEFDLHAFNLSFNKDFYAGYAAYKTENDSYVTGAVFVDKKTGEKYEKYNEWTRAMALVNKLCTRLSGNTRNLIACFVDRIVEQYADNGIHNCLLSERHIVQLHHALTQTDGFSERVPLHPFVSTLSNYSAAVDWIDNCRDVREQVKQLKAEGQEIESADLPEYPDPKYKYDFEGYVGEICRSVKMRKAEKAETDAEKALYLETSVSREFKQFCSHIVYEAILRIGYSLRLSVKRSGVKTISDAMVQYVLEQIHAICGIDYSVTEKAMTERLTRFGEWRAERKDERKRKRESGDADGDGEDVEEDDEEPDVPEEVEVEAEEEEAEAEEEEEDATEEVDADADADAADGDAAEETEEVEVEYEETA
jgi:hypothetical protein